MTLAYDFDIFRIVPDLTSSDPQLSGLLDDLRTAPQAEAATVALFRDPRTAGALRRAPSGLRSYLIESGFGLNTYSSGAPAGHYPASDEAARLELIHLLAENAQRFDLPCPEETAEGGDVFRLAEFLQALDQSQPVDMAGSEPAPQDHATVDSMGPVRSRRHILPSLFDTEPLADAPILPPEPPARRKFWQSRYFRIGAAAVLVLGAMQLASGPALTVLASL